MIKKIYITGRSEYCALSTRVMSVNMNIGIICVCVVLFMAIEAMGVAPRAAPMDQIPGTFLLCHC